MDVFPRGPIDLLRAPPTLGALLLHHPSNLVNPGRELDPEHPAWTLNRETETNRLAAVTVVKADAARAMRHQHLSDVVKDPIDRHFTAIILEHILVIRITSNYPN